MADKHSGGYEPGKMSIDTQRETYEAFWTWSWRIAVACVVALVLLYAFRT